MANKNVVLVIGASGFLGRGISGFFLMENIRVVGLDRNPADPSLKFQAYYRHESTIPILKPILEEWKPELIINAAGRSNVGESFLRPEDDYGDGPSLCFQILESIHRYSPKSCYLFISSAAVYGQPLVLPVSESVSVSPISPYGYHKHICELLVQEYNRFFNLNAMIIRIFSAYGNGLRKQIIWDICQKCKAGHDIMLSGTGDESRDFIHIIDISRAIYLLWEKGCFNGSVYNLASGRDISLLTLAELVVEKYGIDPSKIHFTGLNRIGDPQNWRADISRLNELNFEPSIQLEKGIGEYVEWFKKNQC